MGLSDLPGRTEVTPAQQELSGASGGGTGRPGSLSPVDTGIVAPTWAMPAEVFQQASQRLRLVALGLGLAFAVASS